MNFLGYAHWFISIRISQLKDHSISVDQTRYATSIVAKYLDTATVTASKKFYKTMSNIEFCRSSSETEYNAACTIGMALSHFRMHINELLNKYSYVVL